MDYTIKKISADFEPDGDFSKPVWEKAAQIDLVDNRTGGEPKYKTGAKMLYSDNYLYAAFYCQDPKPFATLKNHDDDIWQEDVVEIFINPSSDKKLYFELQVNPLNAGYDAIVLNGSEHGFEKYMVPVKAWNLQEYKHGVKIGREEGLDQWWSAEMVIPFRELVTAPNVPPKEGDVWLANLYRFDVYDNDEIGFSWSPTMRETFHVPGVFGQLLFS
jgi:hypothetical protein